MWACLAICWQLFLPPNLLATWTENLLLWLARGSHGASLWTGISGSYWTLLNGNWTLERISESRRFYWNPEEYTEGKYTLEETMSRLAALSPGLPLNVSPGCILRLGHHRWKLEASVLTADSDTSTVESGDLQGTYSRRTNDLCHRNTSTWPIGYPSVSFSICPSKAGELSTSGQP